MRDRIAVLLLALLGGVAATLALATVSRPATQAASQVLYVAADCSSAPRPCYSHIQTAIIVADPGDEIHIAGGVYTDYVTNYVARVDKPLTLRGGYSSDFSSRDPDAYPTIIDAEGERRAVYVGKYTGETITVTLDGLHLINGDADGLGGEEYNSNDVGGGLYASHAVLHVENCHIAHNRADQGAGIYFTSVDAVISGTRIYSNTATLLDGGGIYHWSGLKDGLTFQNTVISGNVAASMGGGGHLVGPVTMSDSLVYGNTAAWAGGGLLAWGEFTLTGSQVLHNSGIGLSCWNCLARMSNNVFASNYGTGLAVSGIAVTLLHTTIADNEGTGLWVSNSGQFDGLVTATNTIIAGNVTGVSVEGGATATLDATLWWDNDEDTAVGSTGREHLDTGTHNYTADPAFADADGDDYHLRPTSPAIDRGLDAGVSHDLDGDPRPWGAAPDLGADEYRPLPPSRVVIAGPLFGLTNSPVLLVATVSPATAMLPITYTWQATGQTPVTHVVNDITDRVAFTWGVTGTNFYPVTGTKHITVTASNGYGTAQGHHTLTVKPGRSRVYLPLVVRGG